MKNISTHKSATIIRKSPLAVSIMLAISGMSVAHADEVSCTNSNCSTANINNLGSFTNALTTTLSSPNATQSLTNNTVTLNYTGSGQPLIEYVFGAFSSAAGAEVTGNTVNIGGDANIKKVYGGTSLSGNANGNTVNISGGTIRRHVFGGWSSSANATGNTVNISGGKIRNVTGGRGNGHFNATGNTVNISGNAEFYSATKIFGGRNTTLDKITGNTLNYSSMPISITRVNNFEHYNFFIGKTHFTDVVDGTTPMIRNNGNQSRLTNSFYSVGFEGGTRDLLKDVDKVNLISKTNMANPNARFGIAKQGISRIYDVEYKKQGSALIAQIKSEARVNPQSKALLESALATNDFVNRGADLAVSEGLNALKQSQSNNKKLFIATSFGKNRTETGSHIDVVGANFVLGIGKHIDNSTGRLDLGGFAELGSGIYDTHNDFDNMPDVNASGSTRYFGIGIMAEQSFNSGLSLNAGLRVGKTNTSFNSDDLVSGFNAPTNFDSNRTYISGFAGVGYEIPLSEGSALDLYGNLKYTHLGDDDQTFEGDTFNFDDINSARTTLGARWTKSVSKNAKAYTGAAWEHEFDGTASATVANLSLSEPSLKGGTAILEAGYTFSAEYDNNLQFNIGAKGSIGKRKSVSVNAGLKYDL